jgi:hypothetical protein
MSVRINPGRTNAKLRSATLNRELPRAAKQIGLLLKVDYNPARCVYHPGRLDKIKHIEKCNLDMNMAALIIKNDPSDPYGYFLRGSARGKLGDIRGAHDDLNKCLALDPFYSNAYTLRHACKLLMGDKTGAENDIRLQESLYYSVYFRHLINIQD